MEGTGNYPQPDSAVEVSYTLQRPEARAVLHGFWGRRLLRLSPACFILIAAYVRLVGPPYWVSVLTGLLIFSATILVVMALWDQSQLPSLCRHVHVKWNPVGVQIDTPSGTWGYHWGSVRSCKASPRFVSMRFADGKWIHVPARAFASSSDRDRVLGFASRASLIDVQEGPEERQTEAHGRH